ncbi:hypothetical protein AJ80_06494 [Polytolypa hystricis UAMH7299]|uniref:WIBG Mago-binding domain-containing protein n=1 Tax=Polytolypa hystricis (strain UAMH7299) TaxID=1447883 RepID=A0A2B7XVH1_POLH7|nr:hypothetical protein AJ80_06494 [Polytolypa hystricis UAMH7299]
MAPATTVSSSGITVDAVTGERLIPASTRPDGSVRREIRVRPGYRPPEDVELYKNRTAAAYKNRGKGGIPGAESLKDEAKGGLAATAASNKNAKRREAKKKAKTAENGTENSATTVEKKENILGKENWREPAPEVATDPEAEREKKARNLKKKLRQARELSDKKDKGEDLLPEQFEKVIKIQELIRQLDALGFDADGEPKEKQSEPSAAESDAV